jgi:uncharacterized membrane protein YfcA
VWTVRSLLPANRMLRARDSSDRLLDIPCRPLCLAFIGLALGAVSGFVGVGGVFPRVMIGVTCWEALA